jgi:hypothetical protein
MAEIKTEPTTDTTNIESNNDTSSIKNNDNTVFIQKNLVHSDPSETDTFVIPSYQELYEQKSDSINAYHYRLSIQFKADVKKAIIQAIDDIKRMKTLPTKKYGITFNINDYHDLPLLTKRNIIKNLSNNNWNFTYREIEVKERSLPVVKGHILMSSE